MQITYHLQIDMARKMPSPPIGAVQNDSNTRHIAISLLENGSPWEVPTDVAAAVAFKKADGHRGLYDQLPDGTKAVTIDGSTVTAILAPQVLTCVGEVMAAVIFQSTGQDQLATFPFKILVEANPGAEQILSNDYYAGGLPVVTAEDDGKFLQVVGGAWSAVDAVPQLKELFGSYIEEAFPSVTQTEYDSFVEAGTMDKTKYYMIVGDSE